MKITGISSFRFWISDAALMTSIANGVLITPTEFHLEPGALPNSNYALGLVQGKLSLDASDSLTAVVNLTDGITVLGSVTVAIAAATEATFTIPNVNMKLLAPGVPVYLSVDVTVAGASANGQVEGQLVAYSPLLILE